MGNDPASTVYVGNKKKSCAYIGIRSLAYELPEDTTEEELLSLVEQLNQSRDVHGILVQLPLPKQINEDKIIKAIAPAKDVDGFHPQSVGALSIGQPGFVSCTPAGIIQLLKRSGIEIDGKECVIVGRSNIVGETDGFTSPERKRHSDCLSFPYEEFKGCLQTGGYSCGCHRQTEILQS